MFLTSDLLGVARQYAGDPAGWPVASRFDPVVSGMLTEETVSRGALRARPLPRGAGRRFGPRHVHRVSNLGPDPAISVHCYAPKLRSMTLYGLNDGVLRVAEVSRAGVAW